MEKLSIRKYAERVGVSHTAVSKAIKAGHISQGWDPIAKKVVVDLANKEWGNDVKAKNTNRSDNNNDVSFEQTNLSEADYNPLEEDLSFSEARRRKEIYNAEIARVEALRLQKIYVSKDAVYKALFAIGQGVRQAVMAVPDRYIDEILAEPNRALAHQRLTNALHETLTRLSQVPDLEQ